MSDFHTCWICESIETKLLRRGISQVVTADELKITDADYGRTLDIYECSACKFQFCPETLEMATIYEGLEDKEYEDTREPRLRQADRLLAEFPDTASAKGSLLDIGAGSGILLEAAKQVGLKVRGIEPSHWLIEQARERGLNIDQGILDRNSYTEKFDLITIIDVIEHVQDPVSLLENARDLLADKGYLMVVTPDRGSVLARVMGFSWWHYRVAHIGYFDAKTLRLACQRSGLEIVGEFRPKWFFTLSYILQRLKAYLPVPEFVINNKLLRHRIVPLNLFDSLGFILRKAK